MNISRLSVKLHQQIHLITWHELVLARRILLLTRFKWALLWIKPRLPFIKFSHNQRKPAPSADIGNCNHNSHFYIFFPSQFTEKLLNENMYFHHALQKFIILGCTSGFPALYHLIIDKASQTQKHQHLHHLMSTFVKSSLVVCCLTLTWCMPASPC